MPSYRCCFLDRDRHTVKVEIQDCHLAQYTFVEPWLDRRLVERRKRAPAVRQ
ncbi:MAG TPA: hypothetical protein VMH36_24270 [Alphaproteobacteria bacterium]|nr:hypothetical protein [Alphaproteobacteria bacterium]